jgi:hypothetical protein
MFYFEKVLGVVDVGPMKLLPFLQSKLHGFQVEPRLFCDEKYRNAYEEVSIMKWNVEPQECGLQQGHSLRRSHLCRCSASCC